ncbi:hypothetical protein JW948_19285 [bacterium]|nr:hypothetical protein [bacterium]
MKFQSAVVIFCLIILTGTLSLMAGDAWLEHETYAFPVSPDQVLDVDLNVDVGEVQVALSDSENVCQISMSYIKEDYRAKADFNEKSNALKIRLDKKGWNSKFENDGDNHIRAEVLLPANVVMQLKTRVKAGEVTLDMSGLSIREFHLRVWAGEVSVHFDEPNPVIMDYLDISASIGSLTTSQLGNARFKRARINGGIGEINVDLTGEVLDKAKAKVDLDIGEAQVILPEDCGIRLAVGGMFGFMSSKNIDNRLEKHGRYYYSEDFDENETSFSVLVTPGLGELNIECE